MSQEAPLFPIAELTHRTGASKRVVEHAEARGLIQPAARTPLGYKLYSAQQEQTLRLVIHLYRLGFSASRIKSLLDRPEDQIGQLLEEHHSWLRSEAAQAEQRLASFERELGDLGHRLRDHRRHAHTDPNAASDRSDGVGDQVRDSAA